jgi:hypothetical protein
MSETAKQTQDPKAHGGKCKFIWDASIRDWKQIEDHCTGGATCKPPPKPTHGDPVSGTMYIRLCK